jgi:hypothetical protein
MIPVVITRAEDSLDDGPLDYRAAFIKKPFNQDEVLALVNAIFRRMATASQVSEEGCEIEGSLGQISLVDLLQIFHFNRRNGVLEIFCGNGRGKVCVHQGDVVYAGMGRHRGEKALFRMLELSGGSFSFVPEKVIGEINIRRGTDVLLLEGARQADGLMELRKQMPSDNARLELARDLSDRLDSLHPVAQELLDLLEFYTTVGDLIENCRATDYESCRILRAMLIKGILLAVEESAQAPNDEPLLSHESLYELKVKLAGKMFSTSRKIHGKICIVGETSERLKDFVSRLRRLEGFEMTGPLGTLRRGFGLLGQLTLSENLLLDFVLLPVAESLQPLSKPLSVAMAGALVVAENPTKAQSLASKLSDLASLPGEPLVLLKLVPLGAEAKPGLFALDVKKSAHVRDALVNMLDRICASSI